MDKNSILMNKVYYLMIFLFFYSCEPEKEEQKSDNDVYGCMDGEAINFLNSATINDGSCEYLGCTDSEAANFDSAATIDNGNCLEVDQIPNGYKVFWNDEFNGDSLDLRYWNIELMPPGTVNDELQTYTNSTENILLNNGSLYIRAKKDNPFDPNQPGYTSGRINTAGKVELQYGYWEIRAKLPRGTGTWPAIWMLNSEIFTVGWPYCGEIDIMEHVGYDPDRVFFSIHNTNSYGNVGGTDQQGTYYLSGIENDFHTYAIEWGPTYIYGYIDEVQYFNYNKPAGSDYDDWPYDNPFFLIINLAIGGEWGGQQGVDNSIFPASFIVDYVRMFTKI